MPGEPLFSQSTKFRFVVGELSAFRAAHTRGFMGVWEQIHQAVNR